MSNSECLRRVLKYLIFILSILLRTAQSLDMLIMWVPTLHLCLWVTLISFFLLPQRKKSAAFAHPENTTKASYAESTAGKNSVPFSLITQEVKVKPSLCFSQGNESLHCWLFRRTLLPQDRLLQCLLWGQEVPSREPQQPNHPLGPIQACPVTPYIPCATLYNSTKVPKLTLMCWTSDNRWHFMQG